jgi:hypothetical protein
VQEISGLFIASMNPLYGMITNSVSNYINLLVRIAHTICNHPLLLVPCSGHLTPFRHLELRIDDKFSLFYDMKVVNLCIMC